MTQAQAEENPLEYLGRDAFLDPATGDLRVNSRDDLQRVNFYDNLAQAIRLRLSTAKGSLALHPSYGSRLHEVLGETPSPDVLLLVKAHITDALLQEPRVVSILRLKPQYRDSTRSVIDVELSVQPIKVNDPLNMVYSMFV